MKLALVPGSTSVIVHVFIGDSTSTAGAGKTGLTHSDVTAYYVRAGGTLTAMTMETISTLGTWASTGSNYLGFKKLDDTNAPGIYELHLPNNILAAGANQVVIQLRAAGAVPTQLEIQLANVPGNVQSIADGAITAAAVATDAIDADAIKADAVAEIQSGLATSANQTTILNRIGAFSGTGLNTILGFLRAMAAKASSLTPSDLSSGTTYDNTTDSLEAQADAGGLSATQADWLHFIHNMMHGKTGYDVATGVLTVYEDDGTTVMGTVTPSESGGVITRTPA